MVKIPPENESNPLYDIVYAFKLLLTRHGSDSLDAVTYARTIISKIESIFVSDSTAEVFAYLCIRGAATAWVIQCQLDMPEPTTYRALKHLRSLGIITPALKVSKIKSSKGGPRPIVWAIMGTSPEEVAEALRLHFWALNPKYKIAEEIAQTILDQYTKRGRDEITFRDLLEQIKEMRIPLKALDIADLTAQYLVEKGIKVWR